VLRYRTTQRGQLEAILDDGTRVPADFVVLATGYRVDLQRLPLLSHPSLLPQIALAEGYPLLDERLQASLPGLFFPGLAATRDFRPFFGFVRGCPVAARLIVEAIAAGHP
jgi:NADPH-dependent 2,4-dienoyl-CoA reductase/sulfur reductase-like enzyme